MNQVDLFFARHVGARCLAAECALVVATVFCCNYNK